ncbi:MAG TPA: PepSY domain-containing protein, partial [Candidatus Acidoferrum sp.]|nr:PepSY domain-containing protein [Candidatus Acidoferrum sp.]
EYRDKPLPAWQVRLRDRPGTVVYVDAITGDVTARRNDIWRWYDFLWSLHIMDYRGRDDFNHPLLIGAALLAVLTVLSGLTLWFIRLVRWPGRRRRRDRAAQSTQGRALNPSERTP